GERRAWRFHLRRMAVLLAFGLLHAYLVWPGDILYTYALGGLAVFPFRKWRPAGLLALGLLVLAVGSLIIAYGYGEIRARPPAELRELAEDFKPSPEKVAAELAGYRGGWETEFRMRVPSAWYIETKLFMQ